MADETKEPRRFKMERELSDDDRAIKSRFGGDGFRPERDEYVVWRKRVLEDEHDDLALRERLLREQAEVLRTQAAGAKMDALEALTAEDHARHVRAEGDVWFKGTAPPDPIGRSVSAEKWTAKADELEAEADEIVAHLAEDAAA